MRHDTSTLTTRFPAGLATGDFTIVAVGAPAVVVEALQKLGLVPPPALLHAAGLSETLESRRLGGLGLLLGLLSAAPTLEKKPVSFHIEPLPLILLTSLASIVLAWRSCEEGAATFGSTLSVRWSIADGKATNPPTPR